MLCHLHGETQECRHRSWRYCTYLLLHQVRTALEVEGFAMSHLPRANRRRCPPLHSVTMNDFPVLTSLVCRMPTFFPRHVFPCRFPNFSNHCLALCFRTMFHFRFVFLPIVVLVWFGGWWPIIHNPADFPSVYCHTHTLPLTPCREAT